MVRQNDMGTVADEKIAVHCQAVGTQRVDFFHQSEGIEYHPVADHAAAPLAKHTTRDELENELLPLDGDRVTGVVAAGIAGHDLEPLGENVYDLALALVAPLRSDDDRCLASFQLATPIQGRESRQAPTLCDRSDSHTTRQRLAKGITGFRDIC